MNTPSQFLIGIIATALIPLAGMAERREVSNPVPVFARADQVPEGLSTSDWQGIRSAYDANRHKVSENEDGTLSARNPGQQWTTHFDGRGFLVVPDHGRWTWGLRLTGIGTAGKQNATSDRAEVSHNGGRVAYRWNDSLEEWFGNDRRGLEQGWTINQRPGADDSAEPDPQPLVLTLKIEGDLAPVVSADGRTVAFQTQSGGTALNYGGLKAWDATGKDIPVHFMSSGVEGGCLGIEIADAGATYPIHIDPVAQQQAYLKASNADAGDIFANSVAISGDTVVVGARYEDSAATGIDGNQTNNSAPDSGAAYVFVRDGTMWRQQAYLKASNTAAFANFGFSVAISGDTLVVGAYGEASAATGIDGDQANNSAVNAGAAYVFVRNGATWTQQAYLKASNTDASDWFGFAVAISGDTVVVGARAEDSDATGVNGNQDNAPDPDPNDQRGNTFNSGAAYVFVRNDTTWSQQAYLKASNTDAGDVFSHSVAISGDTVVVGARHEGSAATGINGDQANNSAGQSGAAYVFARNGTAWSQQAYFKASNTGAGDWFGKSVAISGNTAVVGANKEDSAATGVDGAGDNNSATDSGAAYVFVRDGTTWTQQAYLKTSNTEGGDLFGGQVALSGNNLFVSARDEDSAATGVDGDQGSNSAVDSGAAYLFRRSGTTWSQQAYFKATNTGPDDGFGNSVAVSGNTVVVGSLWEESAATVINGNQEDNSAADAGAVYVFVLEDTPLRITDSAMTGMLMTIHFEGEPGYADWKLMGSGDLQSFPDDQTPDCTLTETAPGQYEIEIDCTSLPRPYFLRVER